MPSIITTAVSFSAWGKPTVYYKNSLSGLVATGSASGHPVENILDRLETNSWISNDNGGQNDITQDAGSGAVITADYFAISGHNFANVGATVKLEYSNTLDLSNPANAGTEAGSIASIPDEDDLPFVVEFTAVSARYWRLRIDQVAVIGEEYPKIINGYWGQKVELDYATSSLDPNESEYDDTLNVSLTGIVLGIHKKQRIRKLVFRISDAEADLYDKAKALFEAVELLPFFICWNYDNNPEDCYYMRNNRGTFSAPYRLGSGSYRNLSFDFIGRANSWQ